MIKVVNKYHTSQGEYIGRGSPLGNPFTHMQGTKAEFIVRDRDEAVKRYQGWLIQKIQQNDPTVVNELHRLLELARKGDLELRCYCAPKACHGDVIKAFLESQLKRKSNP